MSRIQVLDFSQPNVYIPLSYIIPQPESTANAAAITYSFQTPVRTNRSWNHYGISFRS